MPADTGARRAAFEDPGYADSGSDAAKLAGVEPVPVPVDDQGMGIAALDGAGVRAVMLTPAHQWPTGVVLGSGNTGERAIMAGIAAVGDLLGGPGQMVIYPGGPGQHLPSGVTCGGKRAGRCAAPSDGRLCDIRSSQTSRLSC